MPSRVPTLSVALPASPPASVGSTAALVLLLALLPIPLLGQVPGAGAAEPEAVPDRPAAERPGGAPRAGEGFAAGSANLSRIWWNQPQAVEGLGLTEEQRKGMDALLIEHLERRRELARESFELRRTLGDHLAAGDWKAAEAVSTELGERTGALTRADAELATAVVRLLRPDQRRTLDEKHPMILRRPWLQGGMGLRPGRLQRPGGPRRSPGGP